MAHRARSLNSLFALLLTACLHDTAPVVPRLAVSADDPALERRAGFLYLHGSKFSGLVVALYPSGDTLSLASYAGGREEGRQARWHANGRLAEVRWFASGRKEGLHQGWFDDGRPRFSYAFANDEYEGEVAEWYATGIAAKRYHFHEGHPDGRQQLWWEDGSVRANFTIRDGRSFGLIGRKLCRNNESTHEN